MGPLQLCAKKYAMVSNNQPQKNTESVAKLNFGSGMTQLIRQRHLISLLSLLFFLLFFLLPGHAIAGTGSITGFSQPLNCLACDSDGATSDGTTSNVSLHSPLYVNPTHRIHYTAFTDIPLSIDSRNREDS